MLWIPSFESFRTDRRGQPVVVGVVLLLAIVVIAFAGYQAYSVPQQNSEVEFEHNLQVQEDLHDLRNTISNARRSADAPRSVDVRLGTTYPTRIAAVNPPPSAGRLSTVEADTGVQIDGAQTVSGPYDGDTNVLFEEHDTALLTYQPRYAEYRSAPQTTYEHTLLYNRFTDAEIDLTDQRLVDGDRINVVLLEGEYHRESVQAVSVDPEVLSGPTEDVRIETDDATITVPTRSPGLWADLIGESFDEGEPRARISSWDRDDEHVEIELRDGTYDLRMVAVGIDGGDSRPDFDISPVPESVGGEPSTYEVNWQLDEMADQTGVTRVDDGLEIGENVEDIQGIVEVRERNGDPVDGTTVDFGTNDPAVSETGESAVETDSDGIATVDLETTGEPEDRTRLFAAAGDDVDPMPVEIVGPEFVELTAEVTAVDVQDRPSEVTFEYELTTEAASVTFDVEYGTQVDSVTETDVQQGTTTVSLGPPGQRSYPITVRGYIDGEEECTAVIEAGDGRIDVCE